METTPGGAPSYPGSIERCRKLARLLRAGRVTFEEYALNAMLTIVSAPEADATQCIESIPRESMEAYADYLRAALEPVEFMPDPGPFMVDTNDSGLRERLKRQFRPRYLRLYRAVCHEASIGPAAVATSPEQP